MVLCDSCPFFLRLRGLIIRGKLDSDPPDANPSSLVTLHVSLDGQPDDELASPVSADVISGADGSGRGDGVGGIDVVGAR